MSVKFGHVYFLDFPIAGKGKLCVPAYADERTGRIRFFFVNTEVKDYIVERPELRAHNIAIRQKTHAHCLDYDSWLMCHEVIGGWTVEELLKQKNCYRGPLDKETIATLRALIKDSRLYSESEKALILAQWPK